MSKSNKPGDGSSFKRFLDGLKSPFRKDGTSRPHSPMPSRPHSPMPAVTPVTPTQSAMGNTMVTAKPPTTADTLQLIIKDLNHAKIEAQKGQWRYTNGGGQEVIVVERIGQLLNGIEDYARIVDVAIQHQPDITALVWAGVRFILQVARNHVESMELLEWTMATVITKMANCEFYAQVYANSLKITLQSKSTTEAFQQNLESALQQLYDALLEFSTKAKEYFDPSNCFAKKAGNALKPFSALVKPLLDKITEKERIVQQYAEMATMQRIMGGSNDLERIQSLLGNIEKEMGPLTKLDDILHVTREIKNMLKSGFERMEQDQRQILFKESASLDSDLLQLKEDYLSACNLMEEFQRDLYVPVQGMLHPYDKEHRDLEGLVRDFLKKESVQKVCLIQGSAGAGKSTFNHYLARKLWKEYDNAPNPADAVIPLFISLARFYRPGSQNEDVDVIAAYFKERDFDKEQIKLARRRQFIFILDGYDEISKRDRNFYTENKLDRWRAKVIITSRPEYLDPGYHSKFCLPGQQSLLQELWIAAFSTQAIQQYIVKFTESSYEGRSLEDYQQMVSHPEVMALISNPFLLRMVMTLEPTLVKGPLKRGSLYEQFIQRWLSRAQERLYDIQLSETQRKGFERLCQGTFTAHAQQFCEEFAVMLYRHKILEVTCDYTRPDADSIWHRLLSNDDEKIRLLRFSSPLIRQRQSYRFLHKSVRDYLVAQAIWNELKETTAQALLNEFYLVDDPGVIDFIVEKSKYDKILQRQLLAWVEQSKTHPDVANAAANAITILVRAGVRFTGHDLCGIRIPGADLSFGWFERAWLQKADLQQVQLRGTWLRGSDFKGANMDGVQFGERPFISVQDRANSVAFSPDGQLVALAGYDYTVQLWSVPHQQNVHTFSGHTYFVQNVAFSPDGQLVASASSDHTVRLWSVLQRQHVHTFSGHTNSVESVAFSPDGQLVASASSDNTVQLWSVPQRQHVHTFSGHTDSVQSVAFSPDGQLVASASHDKTVWLWSVPHQQHVHTFSGHTNSVESVAFSPDGQLVASASEDNTVRLWSVPHQQHIHTFSGHANSVLSVAFSPDGQLVASASSDITVQLWSVLHQRHVHTFSGHTYWVQSVAFSPDGQLVASASWDGTVRLWSVPHQHLHIFSGHTNQVLGAAFSPDGQLVASASHDKTVWLWSVPHQQHVHTFSGHTNSVESVAFSPDGQLVASASEDNTVRLWSVPHQQHIHTFSGHANSVLSVAFSPDGQLVASASSDITVQLWSVLHQRHVHTFSGHTYWVQSVAFSPDGQLVASASWDGTVRLWSVPHQHLHIFSGHTNQVLGAAFSPDGQLVASASSDNTVRLWSVLHQRHVHTFSGHTYWVQSVALSPDGQLVASASWDDTVRLWSVPHQQHVHTFSGHTHWVQSVAFSPDGQLVASASEDNTVRLWSVPHQQHIHTFSGHANSVLSVAFSPDGQLVASASSDNTVRLWSVLHQRHVHTFSGHANGVRSVAFSPDGQLVASASWDDTVRLWSVPHQQHVHTLSGHTSSVWSVVFSPDGQLVASSDSNGLVLLWLVHERQLLTQFNSMHSICYTIAWSKEELLATAGSDKILRVWKLKRRIEHQPSSHITGIDITCRWASAQTSLVVTDMQVHDVTGLDPINAKLLRQRGAIGVSGYESDTDGVPGYESDTDGEYESDTDGVPEYESDTDNAAA